MTIIFLYYIFPHIFIVVVDTEARRGLSLLEIAKESGGNGIFLCFLRYIPSFRTFEFIPDSHKCFVRVCVSDECKCIVGSVIISETLQIKHSSIWISNHLSPVISWHIINFEHFVDRECPSCYPLLNCRCIWA